MTVMSYLFGVRNKFVDCQLIWVCLILALRVAIVRTNGSDENS